jgi:hypothetical protein
MMDDCTNLMAPVAEELLRLALDEEPLQEGKRAHLDSCVLCQRRLIAYKQANRQILSKLYRSTCPTTMQLTLYCANILSSNEGIGITYHVADCPLCTHEIVTIRQTLADFEPFPLSESAAAPQRFVERIIAAFVPWKPQLVMRGSSADTPWPRQYRAREINISLHLSRGSGGEVILLGLFTSDNPDNALEEQEGVPVALYDAADFGATEQKSDWEGESCDPVMLSNIDDLGNVVFKAVPVGEYVMVVRMPESEVVIEGLSIESS